MIIKTALQNQIRMNPIRQLKTLIAHITVGLLILTAAQVSAQDSSADFYVATNGADSNPGTLDKPFATLTRAKSAVRDAKEMKSDKDYLIYIRAGYYHLAEPVDFDVEDSAQAGYHITYAGFPQGGVPAYPGHTPIISGGIALTNWKRPDHYPESLPEKSRGKVYTHDIPDVVDYFVTMYKGTQRLPRAISKGTRPIHKYGEGLELSKGDPDPRQYMKYPDDLVKDWGNIQDVEIVIVASVPWTMNILRLESVDTDKSICKTTIPASYPLRATWPATSTEPCLWVENAIDYLDEPGEWVVNTRTRKIYYWPMEDKPGEDIFVPRMKNLISVSGITRKDKKDDRPVQGLHFEGLTFMHADRDIWHADDVGIQHDWEMEDKDNALILFKAAENCKVHNCAFTNSGGNAIRLDYHCQNIDITNNEISHLGQGGVVLIGYGPGTKDVNKHNVIANNLIHHIGEIYWHSHAIILWQSGHNLVRNNYIRDVPRKAICLSGVRFNRFTDEFLKSKDKPPREYWKMIRWQEIGEHDDWEDIIKYLHTRNNIIEHNEVENAVNMLGDGSAINISGAGEGNIVRRNFVHSINNVKISGMMRTDDYQKGTVFQENILYNSKVGGITLKGENTVINNYLIDVGTEKGDLIHSAPGWGPFGQSVISRNIFFVPGERQKFYYRFTPQDVDALKDSTIDNNIYYCAESDSTAQEPFLKALRDAGHERRSCYRDPLFRNWQKRDFKLAPNSRANSVGIKRLGLETVGLTDEFPSKWR